MKKRDIIGFLYDIMPDEYIDKMFPDPVPLVKKVYPWKNYNIPEGAVKYEGYMGRYISDEKTIPTVEKGLDYYHPIYGISLPDYDEESIYDERLFEHSIMRHSNFYKYLTNLREKTETYTREGFFPERYAEANPMYTNKQDIISTMILLYGEDYKKICVSDTIDICIYNDGSIIIRDPAGKCGNLFLSTHGKTHNISAKPSPTSDHGRLRPNSGYFCTLVDFYDTIGKEGGKLSLKAEICHDGIVVSVLFVELELNVIPEENREVILSDSVYPILDLDTIKKPEKDLLFELKYL